MTTDTAPSGKFFDIVPDVRFDLACRAIYVGQGGNVVVQGMDGSSAVFVNVPDGYVLPVRGVQVIGSGTTAGALVGLL